MRNVYLGFSAFLFVAMIVAYRVQTAPPTPAHTGRATILWISIDGFRHDFLEKDHPPFLSRMAAEGAFSTHMQTIFPTLTFPSHVAEATGTTVEHHGVPANDFFDRVTNKTWVFPPDGQMLTAEPIWNTAARQGIRTEVLDWPLSQMQKGPHAAAYFNADKFDGSLNAQQRMDNVIRIYEGDHDAKPLQLVMGYTEVVDHAEHKYGPESPETAAAVMEADRVVGATFDRVYKDFEAKRTSPDDAFYFLMTTDHGMTTVKTLVRLEFLLGLPPEITAPRGNGGRSRNAATTTAPATATAPGTQPGWVGGASTKRSDVVYVTSGPLGNIYLPATLSKKDREAQITDYLAKLKAKPYIHGWRQKDVPAAFEYKNKNRIGDIVVELDEPYTFSNRIPEAEYPVGKGGGPLGMHGYILDGNPDMEGLTVMWRSKENWGGKDLGIVHATQFHATVAEWLGIHPGMDAGPAISGVVGELTSN